MDREGEEKPESNASFRNVELKPKEVAGFITVTDTLLRNAPASSTIFGQLLSNAIVRAEDRAFINGNGIGKPLGLLLTVMVASWLYKGKLRVKLRLMMWPI